MVLQQEGPALVVQQAAVDGHEGVVPQDAAHVQRPHHGLLSGAVLPGDHHRGAALVDAEDLLLKIPDGPREAEDAVVESALRLRAGGEADARLAGGEGRPPGVHEKGDAGDAAGVDLPGADGVQHPPQVPGDPPVRRPSGLRQLLAQHVQQLRRGVAEGGEKEVPPAVEDHGLADLALDELPEEEVFVPAPPLAAADQQRLIKGLPEAFQGGGHQEGVHAQTLGGGVGQGVTEDGLAVVPLELQQDGLHLAGGGVGMDLHAPAHDLAQPPGALGDVGGGDEGRAAVQSAGQPQGAQEVIHGHLDLHHRQGQVPAQHGGGVPSGDDHIVVPVEIGLGDLQTQLPVTHEQGEIHFRVFLRQAGHQGLHPLVRRDAEGAKSVFQNLSPQFPFKF